MHLIVGLGNPGEEYTQTRHNMGFWVVDELARRWSLDFKKAKFSSLAAVGERDGTKVCLVKPQTFMNLSGEAVSKAAGFYKVDLSQVLVVYDELDLPLGKIRFASEGSSGGHNGIKSIIEQLATKEFPRLRCGIGRPAGRRSVTDHVLSTFESDEKKVATELANTAADAVEFFLIHGLKQSMNQYN